MIKYSINYKHKYYAVLQYVGDIGDLIQKARKSTASTLKEDPNLRKQALQKFLHENPDVKRKMAAAKKAVGTPPTLNSKL